MTTTAPGSQPQAARDLNTSRLGKRLMALAVAVVTAVAGGVLYAPAAAGHGGPIELTANPDGGGGLEVFAHYQEDGHLVEAIMDLVVEGVAADGRTVSPTELVSSAEGQGRWVTPEPLFLDGDWEVTVSTTTPEEATVTIEFSVEPLEPPTELEPVGGLDESDTDPAEGDTAQAASAEGEGGIFGSVPLALVLAAAAAAAAVAAVVLVLRRRRQA